MIVRAARNRSRRAREALMTITAGRRRATRITSLSVAASPTIRIPSIQLSACRRRLRPTGEWSARATRIAPIECEGVAGTSWFPSFLPGSNGVLASLRTKFYSHAARATIGRRAESPAGNPRRSWRPAIGHPAPIPPAPSFQALCNGPTTARRRHWRWPISGYGWRGAAAPNRRLPHPLPDPSPAPARFPGTA